jgi:hypothetical protein
MLMQRRILAAVVGAMLLSVFVSEVWRASRHQIQEAEQQKRSHQAASSGASHDKKTESLWVPADSVGLYTLVLAVFTGVLAGVSIFQGIMLLRADKTTRIAAYAASDSVQTAKDFLERGYVFGGCGQQRIVSATNNTIHEFEVQATHGNYGKTPAFVEYIFVEHCLERDLPPKPRYRNRIVVNDPLSPDGRVKVINNSGVRFNIHEGQIYYGRIVYLDVFKVRHHSSFIYRFDRHGEHEPMSDVDPEYWHWGKDQDQTHRSS